MILLTILMTANVFMVVAGAAIGTAPLVVALNATAATVCAFTLGRITA